MDLFVEVGEEEQFTFEEFYCTLPPWARGRQKEVLAALMFRPNPERGLELSNSDDVTRSD